MTLKNRLIINYDGFISIERQSGAISKGKFRMGMRVRKKLREGSGEWQGHIFGAYISASGIGYAVRSERETNSVQIYPETVLEFYEGENRLETKICETTGYTVRAR